MEQIIEYRAYASAYMANKVNPKGWQDSEMRTLAMEHELALAQEAIGG